ncbi:MAG: cytochrome c3 family protein [Proteobacteria bacterium]|nr:cytochrome c3 family protein [Pseudomonadota bacterium]
MKFPATVIAFAWEIAQVLGALAAVAMLALCVAPVRRRRLAVAPLALPRHELVGWVALGTALGHVLLSIGADRRVLEHLKATAPVYEWAGLVALGLLLLLTVPATESLRRRLWPTHRPFRLTHLVLSAIALPLVVAHVVTTGRYIHGLVLTAIVAGIAALALVGLLAGRPRAAGPEVRAGAARGQALPSPLIALLLLAAAGSLALLYPGATLALREGLVRRQQPLRVGFPHEKHTEVNCIRCHHNYADHTGLETCIGCHRSARADLKAGAEARFHEFCVGCHRAPEPPLSKHGPTTGCTTCHGPVR